MGSILVEKRSFGRRFHSGKGGSRQTRCWSQTPVRRFTDHMNSRDVPCSRGGDHLWAVTAYFNPMRYRRKRFNYQLFRECLGVPLVAVELAYGADFELAEADAEILVKLRGRDVLWQKERLLNIALQALPSSCRKVAWVDCDVIFENNDWPQRTSMLLDAFTMVQPFSHVHWMPPDWESGRELLPDGQLRAVPLLIAAGMPVGTCLGTPASQSQCSCGYAWAANRALLEKNKLYDACIVGGGDSAMVRAAYGRFEDALRLQALNRDHYLNWAIPFHDASLRGAGEMSSRTATVAAQNTRIELAKKTAPKPAKPATRPSSGLPKPSAMSRNTV